MRTKVIVPASTSHAAMGSVVRRSRGFGSRRLWRRRIRGDERRRRWRQHFVVNDHLWAERANSEYAYRVRDDSFYGDATGGIDDVVDVGRLDFRRDQREQHVDSADDGCGGSNAGERDGDLYGCIR